MPLMFTPARAAAQAREFNDQFKAPAAAPPSTAGVMVDQEASEQQEDGPELQAALRYKLHTAQQPSRAAPSL
jgi:hypothetical protein